ncbi:MAG: ATP-binding cassette domain-containing protein, partial [Anaerolineales bacterium]
MKQDTLVLNAVSKSYGNIEAIRELDLEVAEGEILALVGPSGCGKTTLLRLIAGFETPDSGSITLRSKVVSSSSFCLPPEM